MDNYHQPEGTGRHSPFNPDVRPIPGCCRRCGRDFPTTRALHKHFDDMGHRIRETDIPHPKFLEWQRTQNIPSPTQNLPFSTHCEGPVQNAAYFRGGNLASQEERERGRSRPDMLAKDYRRAKGRKETPPPPTRRSASPRYRSPRVEQLVELSPVKEEQESPVKDREKTVITSNTVFGGDDKGFTAPTSEGEEVSSHPQVTENEKYLPSSPPECRPSPDDEPETQTPEQHDHETPASEFIEDPVWGFEDEKSAKRKFLDLLQTQVGLGMVDRMQYYATLEANFVALNDDMKAAILKISNQ